MKNLLKKIATRIKEAIGFGVLPNVSASRTVDESTGKVTWDWGKLIATLVGFGLFIAFYRGIISLGDLMIYLEKLL